MTERWIRRRSTCTAFEFRGVVHDVFFVMTTYGRTEAIDASNGRVLWRYNSAIVADGRIALPKETQTSTL